MYRVYVHTWLFNSLCSIVPTSDRASPQPRSPASCYILVQVTYVCMFYNTLSNSNGKFMKFSEILIDCTNPFLINMWKKACPIWLVLCPRCWTNIYFIFYHWNSLGNGILGFLKSSKLWKGFDGGREPVGPKDTTVCSAITNPLLWAEAGQLFSIKPITETQKVRKFQVMLTMLGAGGMALLKSPTESKIRILSSK